MKSWSSEEEKVLEEYYGEITAEEISEKYLNRGPTSIRSKANRMGLSSDLDSKITEAPSELDISQEKWESLHSSTRHYYRNQKESGLEKAKLNSERREKRRNWIKEIKSFFGCSNCGEDFYAALVFHHLEEKEANISDIVGKLRALEFLEEELEKCTILCANCHRKYHAGKSIELGETINLKEAPDL